MKKKGLIIATIVMVLVLAVSLTTATYAWFNNEGSATVDAIQFQVGAASDIVIGVEKDNHIDSSNSGAGTASNFYSDSTNFSSAGTWTGTTNNLGLSISHDVDLRNMSKAVYSFSAASDLGTADAAATITSYDATSVAISNNVQANYATQITTGINPAATYILKGNGNGSTINYPSLTTTQKNGYYDSVLEETVKGDYLDISFGAAASSANVYAFGCLVYVKPTSGTTLGLNAAIHVAYSTDDSTWKELDIYGANTSSTTRSSLTAPTAPYISFDGGTTKNYFKVACATTSTNMDAAAKGDAYVYIPMFTGESATDFAVQNAIRQLHLVIYICGPDSDCVTSGTGVGATINIEFLALTSAA